MGRAFLKVFGARRLLALGTALPCGSCGTSIRQLADFLTTIRLLIEQNLLFSRFCLNDGERLALLDEIRTYFKKNP